VFHLDVAKVDLDVVLQVFSYVCCKCFHLDVAMFVINTYVIFKVFSSVLQVFQTYVASVSVVSYVCFKCFI